MTAYILSIVGVVFIEAILNHILPNGCMCTVIRCVFAVFLLYIIVSPLSNLTDNFNFSQIFNFSYT